MIGHSKESKIKKGFQTKSDQTEFVMHVSQRVSGPPNSLFDFNEEKLKHYASRQRDPSVRAEIVKLIDLYRTGYIAIAWRSGEPIYIKITRD